MDYVEEKLLEIHEKSGIPLDELRAELEKIAKDPVIVLDPAYDTEDAKLRHAALILWSKYVARPPIQEYEVIPVGIDHEIVTKNGDIQSGIFVLTREGKIRRVVFRGREVERIRYINLFHKYKVKLGVFSSGDFIVDDRSVFNSPEMTKLTADVLKEKLSIPRISIADSNRYLSRQTSDGYVDTTDWKVISGVIIRSKKGERDGRNWGVYTITDGSLSEDIVTPDYIIRTQFTVWMNPLLMSYDNGDYCEFYGSIHISREKEIFMNAYYVKPIITMRRDEE